MSSPVSGPSGQSSGVEYRVRWRRHDRQGTSQIYQSEERARAKADRLMALEEVKGLTKRFADMPDLIGPPTIEVRPVGAWSAAADQPSEASDEAIASMEEWVCPGSQSGVAMAVEVPF
jgi:hypothetical protein